MAPRTRSAGRLAKGPATPQHNLDTQVVHAIDANNRGFPALANEIYLEIMSHIPSVPIPTPITLPSYPKIRRSRHETLLALSQTCRSLRRFFWCYLWQRIEVREGVKIGGEESDVLKEASFSTGRRLADKIILQQYTAELIRQLEFVTVRNPELAQHVNYLDVYFGTETYIGEYSFQTVLAELARCLSLFSNLHTIQIDVSSVGGAGSRQSSKKVFERIFKNYSYPQIRNAFVMSLSESFLASCPQVKRVGFTEPWSERVGVTCNGSRSSLHAIIDNCPHLEAFEDFNDVIGRDHDSCNYVVDAFPNLRHITLCPSLSSPGHIDDLAKLNQLQTITIFLKPSLSAYHRADIWQDRHWKRCWLDKAKKILIAVHLQDKLEKRLKIVLVSGVDLKFMETTVLKLFEDSREVLTVY